MSDASLRPGDDAHIVRGLTYPLGDFAPEPGAVHALAQGLGWSRIALPGGLEHINVWLLDDADEQGPGVALVDTGLFLPASRDSWQAALNGRRVTRVIATHFHPDHIGCAGWLCETQHAPLYMTRTEFLMARLMTADRRDTPPAGVIDHARAAGWSAEQLDELRAQPWNRMGRVVSDLPTGFHRLRAGDVLTIGQRRWRIVVGEGHAPEHACLIDDDAGIMIAGDQVLPRISSNVSVGSNEPDADSLGDWLASIARFRATLSPDLLVLPAHGLPFTGLHTRLDQLENGHIASLDRIMERLATAPRRVVDLFPTLFPRGVGDHLSLATGEALAHLVRLERDGRARRETVDGVWWFHSA